MGASRLGKTMQGSVSSRKEKYFRIFRVNRDRTSGGEEGDCGGCI